MGHLRSNASPHGGSRTRRHSAPRHLAGGESTMARLLWLVVRHLEAQLSGNDVWSSPSRWCRPVVLGGRAFLQHARDTKCVAESAGRLVPPCLGVVGHPRTGLHDSALRLLESSWVVAGLLRSSVRGARPSRCRIASAARRSRWTRSHSARCRARASSSPRRFAHRSCGGSTPAAAAIRLSSRCLRRGCSRRRSSCDRSRLRSSVVFRAQATASAWSRFAPTPPRVRPTERACRANSRNALS